MTTPQKLSKQFLQSDTLGSTSAQSLEELSGSIKNFEHNMPLLTGCLESLKESLHIISDALAAKEYTRPMATSLEMERQARAFMLEQTRD